LWGFGAAEPGVYCAADRLKSISQRIAFFFSHRGRQACRKSGWKLRRSINIPKKPGWSSLDRSNLLQW
jgi:hypothetical protein